MTSTVLQWNLYSISICFTSVCADTVYCMLVNDIYTPTHIEPGGTYDHSPSPEPPYLWKRISKDIPPPPISGIAYRWQLQKTPPFPGFLGKSARDYGKKKKIPRKWERACGPLMHSRGGGHLYH